MSLHFYPSCLMSLSPMSHADLSNAHVALSILEVKGHLGEPFGRGILVLLGRLVGSEWH